MKSETLGRKYLLCTLLFVLTVLSAAPPAHAAGLCTNPTYTTTQNISFSFGSGASNYTVAHDLWNIGPYPDSSWTLQVCNFDSWNELAVANNNSGDGAVKAYPNVHRDYNPQPLISSIPLISVAFAGTAWNSGVYDVAFDIWTRNYQKEIMIWTENHDQLPGGSRVVSNLSISGYTWDLWQSGNSYFAFAPPLDDQRIAAAMGEEDRFSGAVLCHLGHERIFGVKDRGAGRRQGLDDCPLHFGKLLGCLDIGLA